MEKTLEKNLTRSEIEEVARCLGIELTHGWLTRLASLMHIKASALSNWINKNRPNWNVIFDVLDENNVPYVILYLKDDKIRRLWLEMLFKYAGHIPEEKPQIKSDRAPQDLKRKGLKLIEIPKKTGEAFGKRLSLSSDEIEFIRALRELDKIGRRGIYFSAMEEFNDALRERKIKKDSRRKAILEKAIGVLKNAI